LTPEERTRVEIGYASAVRLVEENGFSGVSLLDKGFESLEFGDSIHLSAAGGRRLAKMLAPSVRALAGEKEPLSRP
jgi:lysophospholipase L1-like esterase